MSQELVRPGEFAFDPDRRVVITADGEPITLADLDQNALADFAALVRERFDYDKRCKVALDEELTARLKAARARTAHLGAQMVALERKRQWDAKLAWEALQGLVAAGLISAADADEACPEKTERKPDGRKLNAILTQVVGENPEAAQALAKARTESAWIKLDTIPDAEVVE